MKKKAKKLTGMSPLVSAVILICLVFAITAIVLPWVSEITTNSTETTGNYSDYQLICQNIGYDFDSSFGTNGITWNFTTVNDTLNAKITNTGSVNLYSFSFELTVNTTSGLEIKQISVNATTQKTVADPLKPGQSVILKAVITEDINGTLEDIKILNIVCPTSSIKQYI